MEYVTLMPMNTGRLLCLPRFVPGKPAAGPKHLRLIFIGSPVLSAELHDFRAPGLCYVRNAQWQVGTLRH